MFGGKKAERLHTKLIGRISNHEHSMMRSARCTFEKYKTNDAETEDDTHHNPGIDERLCIERQKVTLCIEQPAN